MRQGLRQSMAWLHAWSGLVVGWVLFAVFVTGTASYYRSEISQWMRPEITAAETDPARSAELAAAFLKAKMPDAAGWYIELPKREMPLITVHWWKSLEGPFHNARLDPATGEPTKARATNGGDFLYRFHFELALPPLWGRWIVGTCALIMLVALVSGIITHRRIFADFFTFRRSAKSAQRAWLDAHNVVGVLGLPFHLMIAYTGLVTLAPMYMPWGVVSAYKGNEMAFFVEAGLMPDMRAPTGQPGSLAPLGPMVALATARRGEAPEAMAVYNPGDAAATPVATFEEPHGLAHQHPMITFDAATGAIAGMAGIEPTRPATTTSTVMVGIHEAHFAGPALRALFFLCGVMGAATVATGLILWAVARAPKGAAPAGAGLALVRILNLGTIVGLPAGVAAYFLANRLLPLDLAARANWEVGAFFAAWILAALLGAARPQARAWREGFALAALLYLAVPVVGAATTGLHPLNGGLRFLGFDLAMLAIALLLGLAAGKIGARPEGRTRAESNLPGEEALRA